MRVKIHGEITAVRLAQALQKASEHYEAVKPGFKIFGANLYLTAYDAFGLPFDLTDYRGESLMITIDANSGELVRPALTAEGERLRQEAADESRRQAEAARAVAREEQRRFHEKHAKEYQARLEEEAIERSHLDLLNEITAKFLRDAPEHFVVELNKCVQSAWSNLQPVEPHGQKKGAALPLPVYSVHAGGLILSVATWKHPRSLLNPIFTIQQGKLTPLWRHEAWTEAADQILVLLAASVSETTATDPKPVEPLS